jgi:hypothetical protein
MNNPPGLLQEKLLLILHRALVESRNLALAKRCEQSYELADALEIVPSLMCRWEDAHLDSVRGILRAYQAKYPKSAYDYLSILDMEEGQFRTVYQRW